LKPNVARSKSITAKDRQEIESMIFFAGFALFAVKCF